MVRMFFCALVYCCVCVAGFAQDALAQDQSGRSYSGNLSEFELFSPVFANNGVIPVRYTCRSEDVNPPFIIRNIPSGTKSMALTMHDPQGLAGTWVHWVVFNIPAELREIHEKIIPGTEALNDFGNFNYGGPCPPDEKMHQYVFTLYALNTRLDNFSEGSTKDSLEKEIVGKVLAKAVLVGTYQNSQEEIK